jgi:hypothetical protein
MAIEHLKNKKIKSHNKYLYAVHMSCIVKKKHVFSACSIDIGQDSQCTGNDKALKGQGQIMKAPARLDTSGGYV